MRIVFETWLEQKIHVKKKFLIDHHCTTTVGMDFRQGVIVSMPKIDVKAVNCGYKHSGAHSISLPHTSKSKHLPPILYAPLGCAVHET